MADLTFLVDDSTLGVTDRAMEAEAAKKRPRRYIGFSEIGDECPRRLWLKFHTDFKPSFSARMLRIFETGHAIERRVVRELKQAGYEVSGRQLRFSDLRGKFKGHCDGIIEGLEESPKTPHVLEIKSASDKRYKDFMKEGMLSNEKYGAQIHLYMMYAGLDRGFFVLENRDTCERYQERINVDKPLAKMMLEKARLIIGSDVPPHGISDRPDWYLCKMCDLNNETYCRRKP